jgi:hypothetical protein
VVQLQVVVERAFLVACTDMKGWENCLTTGPGREDDHSPRWRMPPLPHMSNMASA